MVSPRKDFFLMILCLTLRWSSSKAEWPLPFENVKEETANLAINVATAACDALLIPISPTIDKSKISYELQTLCNNFTYTSLKELFQSKYFNKTGKTTFVAPGWMSTNTSSDTRYIVTSALLCRGNVNIIVINYGGLLNDPIYPVAAGRVEAIGKAVAQDFDDACPLSKIACEKIIFICHSLGAHVCGFIGRNVINFKVGMAFPLDAAGPCFKDGAIGGIDGIKATDADYVIATFSNPGLLGRKEPYGTANYYSEYMSMTQKNCPTLSGSCSHLRAVEVFAETICRGSEYNILAKHCNNMNELENGNCNGNETVYGFMGPYNETGIKAFRTTNAGDPWGLNATTKTLNCYHLSCHLCPSKK